MNMQNLNKIFSISLSLALTATGIPMPAAAAPAAGMPAFAERLAPQASLGYVASSYAAGNEEKPRLVVIADLHAHLDVQRKIMGMMADLLPKIRGNSEKKVPVFLEGGWKAGLEEPLRTMSNPKARTFMNEYFLAKAELGGPQAYSEKIAGTNQITMIGVEDQDEYLTNKAIFSKSYPARKQILEAIKLQEVSLKVLEKHVEARGYKKLKNMRDAYTSGKVSPQRFAKALLRHAERFHMTGQHVSLLKELQTSDPEAAEMAFSAVYKDVAEKLSEKRPLMSYVRRNLDNEPVVRKNVSIVNSDLDLLKRLLANQLSPSEVAAAYSQIPQLERTAKLLLANQPVSVDVSRTIREALEFYPMAFLRDETLAKNSLKALESFGPDATGILVAGGFHTDAIASYLQQRRIPHVVIHPIVSRDMTTDEQINYVKRLCGEHITAKELTNDLTSIAKGTPMASVSAGHTTFAGLAKPAEDASKKEGDSLYNKLTPEVQQALQDRAEDVAALQTYFDEKGMALDVDAPAIPDINVITRDGRYVVAGVEAGVSAHPIVDALNQIRALAPNAELPESITIASYADKEVVHRDDLARVSKDRSRYEFPGSWVAQQEAIAAGEKPAPGSEAEEGYIASTQALMHEVAHAAGLGEKETSALGAAAAAAVVNQKLGPQASKTYARVLENQMKLGNETAKMASTPGFGDRVANILTPKAVQSKPVVSLAKQLAQEFPDLSQSQIDAAMANLNSSMTGRMLAMAGNDKALAGRLRSTLTKLSNTAKAFGAQA